MKYQNLYQVNRYQEDPFLSRSIEGPRIGTISESPSQFFDASIHDSSFCFSFFGHSCVDVHMDQHHILIDPVLVKRMGPFQKGPRRFQGESIDLTKFDDIEVIAITHSHYDHLDIPTLRQLDKKVKHYVVPMGIKKILCFYHFEENKIMELNWKETAELDDLKITCLPSHHNSMRYLLDKDKSLWCSYYIQSKAHSFFHSGDSAFSKHFEVVQEFVKNPDVVFMECGQYNQEWHHMHMFPEESVEACTMLKGKINIPIHWGAYCICNHYWKEPIFRFELRAKEKAIPYLIPKIYQNYDYQSVIKSIQENKKEGE